MKNLIQTNYDGIVILKQPIHTDELTIFGCLTNQYTDLKELHQLFCYAFARQQFYGGGGKINGDDWYLPDKDYAFKCEEGLVKFFNFLFGNKVKCEMVELPPNETISYYPGEVEMGDVIVSKSLIERYTNNISNDGKE